MLSGYYDDRFGHLLVGTKENVIAALNVDDGEIVWRRVLETGDRGSIQFLQSLSDDLASANSIRVSGRQEPDRLMLTVTGTSFVLVRAWNTRTGNLAWEWNIQSTENNKSHWFISSSTLYQVQPNWVTATAEVTAYNVRTGQVESTVRKVATGSSQNCDFVQSFLVCTSAGEVVATDLVSGNKKVIGKSTQRAVVVEVSGLNW